MRLAGRISDWNDDKGFGFVSPHDGGERAFVHIKAFQAGSRRPMVGDLISYEAAKDAKGRTNAISVRYAGQRIEQKPKPARQAVLRHRIPRRTLGALALLSIVTLAVQGSVPVIVPLACMLLSIASYLVYWWDKDAATAKLRRTPESTLHLLDLLGGWPGALIAQQRFRHKTAKASFQSTFWITVLLNIAGVVFAVRKGWAQALSELLLGL